MPQRLTVAGVVEENPELADVLVQHAYRGVRVQFLLRAVLLAFMGLSVGFVPPTHDEVASWLIVASYAAWAVGVTMWTHGGGVGPVRWMWLALLVDAAAITALTLVAGIAAAQSWTADLLINGFFVIPVLAATQLRTRVCALVAGPTVGAYLAVSIVTKTANTEPWSSIILRTLMFAGLSLGCVALTRVQMSRVLTIGGLVRDRTELLSDVIGIEARERADLAEHLHDGALQYLLAARQDLEDARELGDTDSFDRLEHALRESSQLLRSTVTELHPAVLAQAGLARAVRDLITGIAARGGFAVETDLDGWPDGTTPVDALMYSAARELLTNVAKHAEASHVTLTLRLSSGAGELVIRDDGLGIDEGTLDRQLAAGHVGLASQRARITAAGGVLSVESASPSGTVVTVRLPAGARTQVPAAG